MAQLSNYTPESFNAAASTAYTQLNAITAHPNARTVASQAAATLIGDTKSANQTARENTVTAVDKAYAWSETVATAAWTTGSLIAWTNCLTTALAAGAGYRVE